MLRQRLSLGVRTYTSLARSYYRSRAPVLHRCYSLDHSQVVICGGGIIGCSVAYHLAKLGYSDVILLEQGRYEVQL